MTRSIKSYSEMLTFRTFEERYAYLAIQGEVGRATFGFERYLNQAFYTSREWKDVRNFVIARDEGCDLGMKGYEIYDRITVHHIVPMTPGDIEDRNPMCLNPNNLIIATHRTHNAIHFGDSSQLATGPVERKPGDTQLWGSRERSDSDRSYSR